MSLFTIVPFTPYIRTAMESPYSSSLDVLKNLNYNTAGMENLEDGTAFSQFLVEGINGSGSINLSYLKSKVTKVDYWFEEADIGRTVKVSIDGYDTYDCVIQLYQVSESESIPIATYNLDLESKEPIDPTIPAIGIYPVEETNFVMIKLNGTYTSEDFVIASAYFKDSSVQLFNNHKFYFMYEPEIFCEYICYEVVSTLDPAESEVFPFTQLYNFDGVALIIGNAAMIDPSLGNDDQVLIEITPFIDMLYCCFLNVNSPLEYEFLELGALGSLQDYFLQQFEETGKSELKYCVPIITDFIISEAYVQDKLDASKWVKNVNVDVENQTALYYDEDNKLKLCYNHDNSYLTTERYNNGVYSLMVNKSQLSAALCGTGLDRNQSFDSLQVKAGDGIAVDYNGVKVNTGDGLTIDYNGVKVNTGDGLTIDTNSKVAVTNASQTSIGGIKIVASGDTLYISNDGLDPIR